MIHPSIRKFMAVDRLHRATLYLASSWNFDTPPHVMCGNLEARKLLTDLQTQILNEAEFDFRHSAN